MTEEQIEMQLSASSWLTKEADELIRRWKACKTAHARNKLRPKLEHMRARLHFEGKGIDKLIDMVDNEGEEWKNG